MKRFFRIGLLVALLLMPLSGATAPDLRKGGILGQPAPRLEVSTWVNLPVGKKTVDVTDYQGQVRVLFFFQSW